MILDIDNSISVQSFVREITSAWFDIDSMYYDLKSDSQTNWKKFWYYQDCMIKIISNYLGYTSEDFLERWAIKCTAHGAVLMGYHCTRHSDKEIFYKDGILPLSEKTIKPCQYQKRPEAIEMWNYRSTKGQGPYFF